MRRLFPLLVLLAFLVGTMFVLTIDRRFDSFGGDDSTLTYAQKVRFASTSLHQCMVESTGSKWRPVTSLVNYGSYLAYGTNVKAYVLQNIVVHSLSAGLMGLCMFLMMGQQGIERGRLLFPCLGACLYAGLGFAYYNFTQRFGLMEELGVLFTLGMVFLVCAKGQDGWRVAGVNTLLVLGMLTHERFIALVVFASLFPVFFIQAALRRRLSLALLPWLLAALYLYIKGPVLGASILQGTAARDVELIGWPVVDRLWSVVLNIAGYNNGPPHLSAYVSPVFVFYIALGWLVLLLVLLVAWMARLVRDEPGRLVLALGACLWSLILSASVCFRIEFRWLVAPWAVFLLWFFAFGLHLVRHASGWSRGVLPVLALVWGGLSVCQSVSIRNNIEQVFFMWWSRDAETFRNCLERNYQDAGHALEIYFVSPCPMELNRDYVDVSRYKVLSDEQWAGLPEARRQGVLLLRHYTNGWAFTTHGVP